MFKIAHFDPLWGLQAHIPKIKLITNQFEKESLHESYTCSYRAIPDEKFEFGIFSIFGDMTHKLSLQKGGTSH